MEATGIVRKLDELGRVVLPIELRRHFELEELDKLEIFTEDDKIILKKYKHSCNWCRNENELIVFKGKHICKECLGELKNMDSK